MATSAQVVSAALAAGVPPDLGLRVAQQESGLRQSARSPAGAIGVMQLMPATAAGLGVNPYDEQQNIAGGMSYLRQLYDRYGNWDQAVAAYNAGPGTVDKWLAGLRNLPAETVGYLAKILGISPAEAAGAAPVPAGGDGAAAVSWDGGANVFDVLEVGGGAIAAEASPVLLAAALVGAAALAYMIS